MGFTKSIFGGDSGNSGGAGLNYNAGKVNPLQAFGLDQTTAAYNQTQSGLAQQQAFLDAMKGGGTQALQQQGTLSNMLMEQAQGMGPNPAQAQFQQNANQLAQQQAGAISSQKGLSPALAARLIAMQSSSAGQNIAGQAATLQAQQQLGAQNALGNLTGQQVGQQQAALNAYNGGAQGQQSNLLNSVAQFNNANVGMQSNVNSSNAGISAIAAKGQSDMFGGLAQSAGKAAMMAMAKGGMVPESSAGRHLKGYATGGVVAPDLNKFPGDSEAEKKSPTENSAMADGGAAIGAALMAGLGKAMATGGSVIQGKASVKGDSLKNDKVPILASPKEIVLPRSVTMAKDAPKKAAEFVAAVLAKNGMKK